MHAALAVVPVLGSTLGQIFQPLFQAMAWLIAFFYALVPNFAIAIALLTIVVMIVTSPLTVKTTRSSVAMQALAPELKKIQQKYKQDKQKLNEEMMNLYKEHGVNPAGGCLPMLIQFPVFIILYDVIRGLTNTVGKGKEIASASHAGHVVKCATTVCADPRYIGTNTKLYSNLIHSGGKMPAFHIDLAQKVFGHHTFGAALPYIILVAIAIGLQYLQMRQLNSRNKAAAQANPQMQMMQRYMPLIFAVIYLNISAGVNIYFIVSSLCRMGLQEYAFRNPKKQTPEETRLSGSGPPKRKTIMERLADAQRQAIETQQARQAALQRGDDGPTVARKPAEKQGESGSSSSTGSGTSPSGQGPTASGTPAKRSASPKPSVPSANGGRGGSNGRKRPDVGSGNGATANGTPPSKAAQNRSRAKRNRKAR